MSYDRRLHAHRPDLASFRLKGKVEAQRFTEGEPARIGVPVLDIRRQPDKATGIDTQALYGETVTVLDRDRGWAWIQCDLDDYVGYVEQTGLNAPGLTASHMISVPRSFAYAGPDMKFPVVRPLSMGSRLSVTGTAETRGLGYLILDDGSAVVADHAVPIAALPISDPVTIAARFIDTPYLWGGRSGFGTDCSGLIQMACLLAGIAAPRDSDMQANGFGTPIDPSERRAGDLVFWKGHVAILETPDMMIHSSGKTMLVCREGLQEAIDRIKPLYGEPTAWRRPPAAAQ